ncbi:MAG: MBOAT family protein [Prevotella sp.]|nr:MBOAT family protein [Prevotella sp.]
MLFNSFEFTLFLPVVFLLYWFVFRTRKIQNLFLVVASYVFYGWWDWRFLFLIAITSFCSYASGLLLEYFEGKRNRQKIVSFTNIALNLLILCIFKYYNFFMESIGVMFQRTGYQLDWITLDVILPVGISFYTFQALSYTIDVYQRKIKATHDIVEFFAYICFFPQLVAGPIERATNLLPQFQHERIFNYDRAVDGCKQLLWGFVKKIVVADRCAIIVDFYWNQYQELSGLTLLMLGVLFTFQIYCDFSGYSDIAIGCAKLFGIQLTKNFDNPYFSRSIPEFWRKWHISLMTWFRDYIYIPLGGNRCSKWKVVRNVFIVWGISGLWHGADWTFVCWGLFHASLLTLYIMFNINSKYPNHVAQGHLLPNIKELIQMSTTFFLVVIGWIIFRAESMSQATDYLLSICTNPFFDSSTLYGIKELMLCVVFLIIEWIRREDPFVLHMQGIKSQFAKWAICITIAVFTYFFMADNISNFIYFQF